MDEVQIQAGTALFSMQPHTQTYSTYYKVIGNLRSGKPPLVILHGGPGSAHEYLLPLAALWYRRNIPVVLYDQIGCASSTHLRDKAGDKSFWTMELFIQQLESLLDTLELRREMGPGFHLLGHSWGGMVASCFAARGPQGLQRLIIANAPATFDLYLDCLHICMKKLGPDAYQAVEEAIETGDFQSENFKGAEAALLRTFWCRAVPFPPTELEARNRHQADDQTVFIPLYGPTLFQCTGSMRGWDCLEALSQITAPTLVYNGEFDVVQEVAFAPFVKRIPGVRNATIKDASHMSHLDSAETREEVLELVGSFLS